MRTSSLILLLLITALGAGCIQWTLDRFELTTFQVEVLADPAPNFEIRHGLVQTSNRNYLIAGTTASQEVLLTTVNENGQFLSSSTRLGMGVAHDILPLPGEGEHYGLLINQQDSFSLAVLNPTGVEQHRRSYLDTFNTQLGLIESVQAYDATRRGADELLITGTVQQAMGPPRFFLLSDNGDTSTVRTYRENILTTSIAVAPEGHLAFSGCNADRIYVAVADTSGSMIWDNTLPFSSSSCYNSVAWIDDNTFVLATGKSNGSDNDILLLVFDRESPVPREISIGMAGVDEWGFDAISTRNDRVVVLGLEQNGVSPFSLLLLEVDATGALTWQKTFPSDLPQYPGAVLQARDFGFAAFSIKQGEPQRYHLVKTDEEGQTR